MIFIDKKHIFNLKWVYSDRSERDISDETIRIWNFLFSRKLWWKNCRKLTKSQQWRKAHCFQAMEFINPKFLKDNFKTWIKVVSKFNVCIFNTIWDISHQRVSWLGRINFKKMDSRHNKQSVTELDNSFTRSERMFIFILIRLKIAFRRKVGFSQ